MDREGVLGGQIIIPDLGRIWMYGLVRTPINAGQKSCSGPSPYSGDPAAAHVPEAGLNEAALRRTLARARSERHGDSRLAIRQQ